VALLLEGRSHQEAMHFASFAAALCIQVEGAMPSMPSRQQVEAALADASPS
jgi:ribokinase